MLNSQKCEETYHQDVNAFCKKKKKIMALLKNKRDRLVTRGTSAISDIGKAERSLHPLTRSAIRRRSTTRENDEYVHRCVAGYVAKSTNASVDTRMDTRVHL